LIKIFEPVKALIFDCDGTLVDTMPLHWEAWHETFSTHNVDCPPEFLKDRAGSPIKKIISQFNKIFGYSIDVNKFVEEKNNRANDKLKKARAIEPVVEIARQYKGKMPMAVASGGSKRHVEFSLKSIGIFDFFDVILTADDPVRGKPAPDIFLEAAKIMGVDPEYCQVFEDGNMGIQAAKMAGMYITDVRKYI